MKIGVIGHLGGECDFTDGQTVKTKALVEGLRNKGYSNLILADTYYMKKSPLSFAKQLMQVFLRADKIIVLLSDRGRKVLFPILSRVSYRKEIYHYSIGGRLAKEAAENDKYKRQISAFRANWVESQKIARELNAMGVNNASYLPNFKCIKMMDLSAIRTYKRGPFHFCMFSRVMPEKGVEDAMRAIRRVNEKIGESVVLLDIYGPIEKKYEERFQWALKNMGGGYTRYCGIVPPNKSVDTLTKYFMLLFPTYWSGEGMPGTIIDALAAGLPIIARRWEFCDDMVDNNVTGLVYEFDQPEKLEEKIRWAIDNPSLIENMKRNCLSKAIEYSEDRVMKNIIGQMMESGDSNERTV